MQVLRRWCLGVLAAVGLLVFAAPASPATIGSLPAAIFSCGQFLFVQPTYAVPAGNWTLTSWSTNQTQNVGGGGQMALVVFRPTGAPDTYTVVGASGAQSMTAATVNTFSVSPAISVRGSDVLGLWNNGAFCALANPGQPFGAIGAGATPPSAGAGPFNFSPLATGFSLNIQAQITPVSGASGVAPEPVCTPTGLGGCYENFPHQAMCSPAGKFFDILAGQAASDKTTFAGFYNAVYIRGIGLTCNAAGFRDTGTKVNSTGADLGASDAGRFYELYT
jgi:hypothetical protein